MGVARVVIPELRAIEPSWMSTEARISADWFGLGVIRDVISGVTPHAPAVRRVSLLRVCVLAVSTHCWPKNIRLRYGVVILT